MYSLETANGFDLTGEMQHGFKSGKSTITAAMVIQSMIARAIDNDKYYFYYFFFKCGQPVVDRLFSTI